MAYPFGATTLEPASGAEQGRWPLLGTKLRSRQKASRRLTIEDLSPGERRRPVFETLEPRVLLSADLLYGANSNTATDLTLEFDGTNTYRLIDSLTSALVDSKVTTDGIVNITGFTGNDILRLDLGALSNQTINFLGGGSDTLKAAGNVDFTLTNTKLDAGSDSFTISGFEEADLTGGAGDNTLDASGFLGRVTLSGLAGADTLIGASGTLNADVLIGGAGDDTYVFVDNWGNDTLTEELNEGNDLLDFTATTGTLTVNAAKTVANSAGGTLTQATEAAEEIDINLAASFQDAVDVGLGNFKNFVGRLTSSVSELSTALPMLDEVEGTVSSLLGLSDIFLELADEFRAASDAATFATLGALADAVTDLSGSVSGVTFTQGYQGDASGNLEVLLGVEVTAAVAGKTVDINLGEAGSFLGVDIDASMSVDVDFTGGVTLGVTTVSTPTVFLNRADLEFDVDVTAVLNTAAIDLSFLNVSITDTDPVAYNGNVTVTVEDITDGKITLSEMNDPNFNLAALTTITTSSTLPDFSLDVAVDIPSGQLSSGISVPDGLGGFVDLTTATLDLDFPSVGSIFDGLVPQIGLTSLEGIDLLDFSNITPTDVFNMLSGVFDSLAALAQSELLNIVVPFTQLTLGEILDFGEGFKADFLDPLFVSGDALVPDFDNDGLPDFEFDSIQELLAHLTAVFALPGFLKANFNPNNRELTFQLDFSSAQSLGLTPLDFSVNLGDLAGISASTEIDASANLDFLLTFGIDLDPSEDIEIGPATFSPDTAADVTVGPPAGAPANDFSSQVITVENGTNGTFTLSDGVGTTAGLQYNASASTVQSALNGLSADWDVEVTRVVDGNDVVFTLVFKDQADSNKLFDPGALLVADAANLKGAADGILSANGQFSFTLITEATGGDVNVGNFTVNVNRDTSFASFDDLVDHVQGQVNAQIAGLTLGFLTAGNELGTGDLGNGGSATALTAPPNLPPNEDVSYTLFLTDVSAGGDPTEIRGTVKVKDAGSNINDLAQALEDSVNTALGGNGYTVDVSVVSGKLRVAVTGVPDTGDTLNLQFSSPVTVEGGGGRMALDAASITVTGDPLLPGETTTRRLEISADYNDPAFQEMGILGTPTPWDGQLDDSVEFELLVDGTSVNVFLDKANTTTNTDIDDLVTDLENAVNSALSGAGINTSAVDVSRVDPDGNRIVLVGDINHLGSLAINVPDELSGGGQNGAITELGFESGEGGRVAGDTAEFFIENASLTGSASLTASNIDLSAHIGFMAVGTDTANSNGSISISASASIKDPLTGGNRVTGDVLFGAFSNGDFLFDSSKANDGIGTVDDPENGFLALTIGGGIDFDLALEVDGALSGVSNNLDALLEVDATVTDWLTSGPSLNINFSGADFTNVLDQFSDLSFGDVIDGLKFIIDFLRGLDGSDFGGAIVGALDTDLPLIDRSIADLIDIADDLAARIALLEADPAGSIQELITLLGDIFDLPGLGDIISFDPLTGVLGFNFGFDAGIDLARPFSLDLADALAAAGAPDFLANLISLDASGNLDVNAMVDVDLKFGLDLTGDDKALFLVTGVDGTALRASASATGTGLNFSAGLGPFSIFVENGSGGLGANIDLTLVDNDPATPPQPSGTGHPYGCEPQPHSAQSERSRPQLRRFRRRRSAVVGRHAGRHDPNRRHQHELAESV